MPLSYKCLCLLEQGFLLRVTMVLFDESQSCRCLGQELRDRRVIPATQGQGNNKLLEGVQEILHKSSKWQSQKAAVLLSSSRKLPLLSTCPMHRERMTLFCRNVCCRNNLVRIAKQGDGKKGQEGSKTAAGHPGGGSWLTLGLVSWQGLLPCQSRLPCSGMIRT